MDSFSTYILDHLPLAIAVFVILIAGLIFLVWWCATTWERFKNMPCQAHQESISRHSEKLDNLSDSLSKIEGKLEILVNIAATRTQTQIETSALFSSEAPRFSTKHSPRVLNDNGMKIYDYLKLGDFLNTNKDWLISELEKLNPKTALDVEINANTALMIAASDERFNDIKNKIYNSPAIKLEIKNSEQEHEITLGEVLYIISIPLRDLYLNTHPEIKS